MSAKKHAMLDSNAILDRAVALKAAARPFALVTVVRCESPTSAKPGAKAVVEPDGVIQGWIGGGCAQPAVIKMAKASLNDGKTRLIRISPNKGAGVEEGVTDFGMTCHSGGTLDIFIEPVIPRPTLLIIGGSPAAQSLCALAHRVGFSATIAVPGVDAELFPDAEQLVDGFDLADIAFMHPLFVVVATQGQRDEQGLEAALGTTSSYLAFIASRRKAEKLKTYLLERGHDKPRVDAIVSPAGVEIGAVTPEEIALSVLAGLVQARRSGIQDSTILHDVSAEGYGEDDEDTLNDVAAASVATDPVCGMRVETATAEYHVAHRGATYYFCCAGCQHAFEKEPDKYLGMGVGV